MKVGEKLRSLDNAGLAIFLTNLISKFDPKVKNSFEFWQVVREWMESDWIEGSINIEAPNKTAAKESVPDAEIEPEEDFNPDAEIEPEEELRSATEPDADAEKRMLHLD